MKTAISIPDALFHSAERAAKRLGITRSKLYQRAVAAFLHADGQEDVTKALDEVYGRDAEEARVDPLLHKLQAASIPEEEW